ncbi:MAG: SDR family oxidoreductase [Chloroflexi bacterium]|nr:SDR family oxidoreductase [Chloroflexota bacterium]
MPNPLFDLSGRTAVVMGGAADIGAEVVRGLAEAGANVAIADPDLQTAKSLADELTANGARVIAVECDTADADSIRELFTKLDSDWGIIDILATTSGESTIGRPEDMDADTLKQTFDGVVFCRFVACQEAGKRMLELGKGSIINIGSIGGVNAFGRAHTAFGIAMGGVVALTNELSTEWASRGVRVNSILIPQLATPAIVKLIEGTPEYQDTFVGASPMGRLGLPEEIRGVAVFLASDASSFVTGVTLPMDGGNLAMNGSGTYPGSPRFPFT